MKVCSQCHHAEDNICDFCLNYDFNCCNGGGVDMGICLKHNAYRDPDSEICDAFICSLHSTEQGLRDAWKRKKIIIYAGVRK